MIYITIRIYQDGKWFVTVPCRNRRLFCHILQLHHCFSKCCIAEPLLRVELTCTVYIRYSYIYEARLSPTLSGSSALQCIGLSNALEVHDEITIRVCNIRTGIQQLLVSNMCSYYTCRHMHEYLMHLHSMCESYP